MTEMPSVTKLLNRKSMGLGAAKSESSKAGKPSAPPPSTKAAPPAPAPAPSFEPSPPISLSPSPPALAPTPAPVAPSAAEPSVVVGAAIESAPVAPASGGAPGEIALTLSGDDSGFQLESTIRPDVPAEAPPAPEGSEPVVETRAPSPALELSASDEPAPAAAAPAPASAASDANAAPAAPPKLKKAGRRAAKAAQPPIAWTLAQIRAGSDPLGRGLAQLIDKGATRALFLAITSPKPGSPVPVFVSSAALQAKDKIEFWTGLAWDPQVVPELWNAFVKTGYVELSPPSTMTNVASARNVVRGAFGVDPEEYLTLVRAGPANACRGVLAIISKGSLLTALNSALPLISALPGGGSKAA